MRNKMEYPALLDAGMHNMTFSDLESVFVTPFESNERRKILLSRLAAFTERLKEVPIDMEVWIDGSFATAKENPGDIDLVVVCAETDVNNLPQKNKRFWKSYLVIRNILNLDMNVMLTLFWTTSMTKATGEGCLVLTEMSSLKALLD